MQESKHPQRAIIYNEYTCLSHSQSPVCVMRKTAHRCEELPLSDRAAIELPAAIILRFWIARGKIDQIKCCDRCVAQSTPIKHLIVHVRVAYIFYPSNRLCTAWHSEIKSWLFFSITGITWANPIHLHIWLSTININWHILFVLDIILLWHFGLPLCMDKFCCMGLRLAFCCKQTLWNFYAFWHNE